MTEAQAAFPATASLGGLLRHWRAARKLSQLELALESGISQRHLSFVESGRATPSRRMVLQLAETLDVPLRERNTLLQAAGYAAVFRQRDLDAAEMAPVRQALEMMLDHHEPYPAVVVDRDWNLLMANAAVPRVLAVVGDIEAAWQRTCGEGPRNLMRLTFHPAGLRPYIANWDEAAPMLLQRLQREAAAAPSEGLEELIAELRADPEIPAPWHSPDLERGLAPVVPLQLVTGGVEMRLFTMISTFGTPQDLTTDEIRVESFFPADTASGELLAGLAES